MQMQYNVTTVLSMGKYIVFKNPKINDNSSAFYKTN